MYDIACMLQKHLRKNARNDLLERTTFAVPVFHSFAHIMQCQVLYGQRNVDGTGLADGEGTERLWAFLRRLSKITKEMSLHNRQDLLVDALYHYSKKTNRKLCERIQARYNRAKSLRASSLESLEKDHEIGSLEDVRQWHEERKSTARAAPIQKGDLAVSPEEEYSWLLYQHLQIRNEIQRANSLEDTRCNLSNDLERIEQKLMKIEKKENMPQRWTVMDTNYNRSLESFKDKRRSNLTRQLKTQAVERIYLLSLMKKYADGQDISIRVGKRLQSVMTKSNSLLKDLNSLGGVNVTFAEVSSPSSPFFADISTANFSQERMKAIELFSTVQRAEEEMSSSLEEMKNTVTWISKQEDAIMTKILELQNVTETRMTKGQTCALLLLKIQFENWQNQAYQQFSSDIQMDNVETPVLNFVLQSIQAVNFEPLLSPDDLRETLELIETFQPDITDENLDEVDEISDEEY